MKMEKVNIMKERILEILAEIRPEFDFTDSEDYVEDGYLDSFDIVTVIDELEKEFGIIVDGLEVIPENFATVDTIEALVNKSERRQ